MISLQKLFTSLWGGAGLGHTLLPAQAAPNTLNGLPAELILLISKFLQPVDLHCFSLCSRWLSMVLSHIRRNLRYDIEREKLQLLYRLDRDLPDRFICHRCVLLHRYDESWDFGLPHPFDFRPSHPCVYTMDARHKLQLYEERWYYFEFEFSFYHLQLAMKRFYYGPTAGISTDSLFTTEVSPTTQTTILSYCEARICYQPPALQPPALQLRVQDIVLFHSDQGQEIKWCETMDHLRICHHESNMRFMMKKLANQFFKKKNDVISSNSCKNCNTDYQVELRVFHGEKLAFVVTRWIDLGCGITPTDPRWAVHAERKRDGWRRLLDLNPSDMNHSPRAAFEEACGERNSLDFLRSRNLAYLNNGNYRKVMRPRIFLGATWYLRQKNLQ